MNIRMTNTAMWNIDGNIVLARLTAFKGKG
jgi:hypothetical protein